MEIKCSRRAFFGKSGFTLIELLVVVLIIGILAAVALPQYNKAVKKAQGTEALEALNTYDKAQAAYYLEHGTYENLSADTLSIQMPLLKHTKYQEPGGETSAFQVGSHYGNKTQTWLDVRMGDQILIDAEWEKGKLLGARCRATKCEDYFNTCRWVAPVYCPSCKWCYLN